MIKKTIFNIFDHLVTISTFFYFENNLFNNNNNNTNLFAEEGQKNSGYRKKIKNERCLNNKYNHFRFI